MKEIYAITVGNTTNLYIVSSKIDSYYVSEALAIKALAKIAKERRNRLGVKVFDDSERSFGFTLGWEETEVLFKIIKIEVNDK